VIFKSKLMTAMLCSIITTSSQAAPFANGGFDDKSFSGEYLELKAGNEMLSPWKITKESIDIIGTHWKSDQGNQSLDLVGSSNSTLGEISQTFDTTPNKKYLVKFKMSGNPVGGEAVKVIDVSVKNSDIDLLHYEYNILENKTTKEDMKWREHSFTFTAQGTSATLVFTGSAKSGARTNFGPALDSVSVTEVKGNGSDCCCCCKCCDSK